jgi:hypothetical protein
MRMKEVIRMSGVIHDRIEWVLLSFRCSGTFEKGFTNSKSKSYKSKSRPLPILPLKCRSLWRFPAEIS